LRLSARLTVCLVVTRTTGYRVSPRTELEASLRRHFYAQAGTDLVGRLVRSTFLGALLSGVPIGDRRERVRRSSCLVALEGVLMASPSPTNIPAVACERSFFMGTRLRHIASDRAQHLARRDARGPTAGLGI
jgi:hypothetical protein